MKQKNFKKKLLFPFLIIVGFVFPFVPYLAIIEVFFLLIPFAIIFAFSSLYLLYCLIKTNKDVKKASFLFSILPVFLLSQYVSTFFVQKVQRLRSESIIEKIELVDANVELPEKYPSTLGINYARFDDYFTISYSCGFLVTEKYNSKEKHWERLGWND